MLASAEWDIGVVIPHASSLALHTPAMDINRLVSLRHGYLIITVVLQRLPTRIHLLHASLELDPLLVVLIHHLLELHLLLLQKLVLLSLSLLVPPTPDLELLCFLDQGGRGCHYHGVFGQVVESHDSVVDAADGDIGWLVALLSDFANGRQGLV